MPSLYPSSIPPTWKVPAPLLRRPSTPLRPAQTISYAFDPNTLDIAVDGAGRVIYASADQSAVQAAAYVVSIQPGRYPIFSPGFGCDLESCIMGNQSRLVQERAITAEMRRAITATGDRRFRGLENFSFDWSQSDAVIVTYTLALASGTRIRQNWRVATQ